MFGLSTIELLFVGALALVLIGPRELPQVIRSASTVFARMRRAYQDVRGSLTQLEREIDIVDNPDPAKPGWVDFLPDELQELKDSIQPHTDPEETAEKYRQVRSAVAKAKQEFKSAQTAEQAAEDSARAAS